MRYYRAMILGLVLGSAIVAALFVNIPQYVPKNAAVRVKSFASTGSGSIVRCWRTKSGFYSAEIYTVAHLFITPHDKPEVEVFDPNGSSQKYMSRIVSYNRDIDFAILLIDHMIKALPVLRLAEVETFYSDNKPGDKIYVIGCSLGHRPFIKKGKINWLRGEEGRINPLFISIDCHVIYGDSGGPVLNENGELIGLVSKVSLIRAGFSMIPHEAITYIVPLSLISEKIK